jgi:hypothetical protein
MVYFPMPKPGGVTKPSSLRSGDKNEEVIAGLWGEWEPLFRDLVCGMFVADSGKNLLNHDKLSIWFSSSAQMFQYGEAVLVGPVVHYFEDEEDGDVLLLCRQGAPPVKRPSTVTEPESPLFEKGAGLGVEWDDGPFGHSLSVLLPS